MALTRSTLLSLNALAALIATMILLPPAVRASNVANVTITTECTNCVGSQFAVYNDAVFLVAKGIDSGGAPTIEEERGQRRVVARVDRFADLDGLDQVRLSESVEPELRFDDSQTTHLE